MQEAIAELRSLAHGIFPPLLVSDGLGGALAAAAGRAALPTTVDTSGIARYTGEIEAAVYFCVLEALQNAGKHAGDGASARVTVWQGDGELHFEVADDGAGFDATASAGAGPRLREHGRSTGCLRRHPHRELRTRRRDDGERIPAGVTSRGAVRPRPGRRPTPTSAAPSEERARPCSRRPWRRWCGPQGADPRPRTSRPGSPWCPGGPP